MLVESVAIEKPGNERSERAAMNQAEKIRTRLLAEADSLKVARTKSTFEHYSTGGCHNTRSIRPPG